MALYDPKAILNNYLTHLPKIRQIVEVNQQLLASFLKLIRDGTD